MWDSSGSNTEIMWVIAVCNVWSGLKPQNQSPETLQYTSIGCAIDRKITDNDITAGVDAGFVKGGAQVERNCAIHTLSE